MATEKEKRELISRMYSIKRGDIDAAVDLAGDLMAVNYWNRETSHMLSRIAARNESELDEFNERIRTL